jgi:hypothetical protein
VTGSAAKVRSIRMICCPYGWNDRFRAIMLPPLQSTVPAYAGSGDPGRLGVKGRVACHALMVMYSYRPGPASW